MNLQISYFVCFPLLVRNYNMLKYVQIDISGNRMVSYVPIARSGNWWNARKIFFFLHDQKFLAVYHAINTGIIRASMCKLGHPLGVSRNGWLISNTIIFHDDSKNRIRRNILVRNMLRTRIFVLIRFLFHCSLFFHI